MPQNWKWNACLSYFSIWKAWYTHILCQMVKQLMQTGTLKPWSSLFTHIPCKRLHYSSAQWKLHHDNVRLLIVWSVSDLLTSRGVEVIAHAPYSSDLMARDFFIFPTCEKDTRGRRFESPHAALGAAETAFKCFLWNGFQHLFYEWQWRWAKCVALNGLMWIPSRCGYKYWIVSKIQIFFKIFLSLHWTSCVVCKCVYMRACIQGGPKVIALRLQKMGSPGTVFAVSSENIDSTEKLFNMKIFSIKFVIKKVVIIFGARRVLFPKNVHDSPKCFKPVCNNFWPPCI